MKKILSLITAVLMIMMMAACGGESTSSASSENASGSASAAGKTVDTDFATMTWDEVLAEANGQTVNWYLWGGSTSTNNFIDNEIAQRAAEYGITINRVGVNNITEAVNMVIAEKQAGKDEGGTADLFWANGSNFMMMQQAGVMFPGWAEALPNSKSYVNWDDYSIAYDMGFPVDGQESPWMTAQLQVIYDSARLSEEDLPKNYTELLEWAKANPGRFTFPAPPDFTGTRFIKGGIYELTGGYEGYTEEGMTKEDFAAKAQPMFDWLEEIKPYLWREGSTFPQSNNDNYTLFNNGEVDFALTLNGMGISASINEGTFPSTAKVYCMDTSISDTNYVSIPYNSSNKAAALVIANILLEPEVQAINIEATAGAPALDFSKLNDEQLARFEQATSTLYPDTFVTEEEKARTRAPEVSSYLNPYIEQLFAEKVAR